MKYKFNKSQEVLINRLNNSDIKIITKRANNHGHGVYRIEGQWYRASEFTAVSIYTHPELYL